MEDQNNADKVTPFAVTNFRDIKRRFGIKRKNRRGHIYIIGKTGTGKSTLIENMVISDIKAGYGLGLIDPHGDLAEDILDYIPEQRIKDVIYFNPADKEYPIPFNPLERVHSDYHHLVASGLISVFKKVWSDFWGPRLEHILRHCLLTLLECPDSTLIDIPWLLTDANYRNRLLSHVKQSQVRDFWFREYDKYSPSMRSQAISPILNKVSQFLAAKPLRNIVGQKKNTFRFRRAMDEGKIFIANLSKGKIGEDNCSLLGAMLVTQMQLAALSRADIQESKRRGFYLYVDEMHNFVTRSFADILSESRKYGLNLTLSHQFTDQLDEKVRAAIFGNVGTLISFRVGLNDAKYLAGEFWPVFTESDLLSLPNYHIYLKLLIDGVTSRPFSAVTFRTPEKNNPNKRFVVQSSRSMYAITSDH